MSFYKRLIVVSVVFLGLVLFIPNTNAASPIGHVDSLGCDFIYGWAGDPDTPNSEIIVRGYMDGPASTGRYVGEVSTNILRTDMNAQFGVTGNHGYGVITPDFLKDGQSHSLYVYAVDANNGALTLLDNSPGNLQCEAASSADPLVIDALGGADATVGVFYQAFVGVRGGTTPYSASISGGVFPPGLQVIVLQHNLVAIQGTPTTADTYAFTIRVSDSKGQTTTRSSGLIVRQPGVTVTPTPTPTLTTEPTPTPTPIMETVQGLNIVDIVAPLTAKVGVYYEATARITGGTAPYSGDATGQIPPGLQFRLIAGNQIVLNGIPTQAGTYSFTLNANDSSGLSRSFPVGGFAVRSAVAPTPVPTPIPPTTNQNPVGFLDVANCDVIYGWAGDPNTPNSAIKVRAYKDGPAGQGVLLGEAFTNVFRSDINAHFGITGNHGFYAATPSLFKDGSPHSLYIYAIDANNGTAHLVGGAPKTINCPTTVTGPIHPQARLVEQTEHGRLFEVKANESNKQWLLELWGNAYEMGYAHGYLMADQIVEASRITTSYFSGSEGIATQVIPQSQRNWATNELYPSLPQRYQDEFRGMAVGMLAKRGVSVDPNDISQILNRFNSVLGPDIDAGTFILHSIYNVAPTPDEIDSSGNWLNRRLNSTAGSSTMIVWGNHTINSQERGNTVSVATPDLRVPAGRANNRVIIARHGAEIGAFDHVIATDAGAIGMSGSGMNSEGVTVTGSATALGKEFAWPTAENCAQKRCWNGMKYPYPIPDDFLPTTVLARYILETEGDSNSWNTITNLIGKNQPINFNFQVSRQAKSDDNKTSVVYENVSPLVPGYPESVMRTSDWDNLGPNDIVLDGRFNGNEFVGTNGEMIVKIANKFASSGALTNLGGGSNGTYTVEYADGSGKLHSGTYSINGKSGKFFIRPVGYFGVDYVFPVSRANPAITDSRDWEGPYGGSGVFAANSTGTSGYYITEDAKTWGTWTRSGSTVSVSDSSGAQIGTGIATKIGDVGYSFDINASGSNIKAIAWTKHGNDTDRLFSPNGAWLPVVQTQLNGGGIYEFQVGFASAEARHRGFTVNIDGKTNLDVDSAFDAFRQTYRNFAQANRQGEHTSLHLVAYSSENLEIKAVAAASIGGRFYSAISAARIPIKYTWDQLFGSVEKTQQAPGMTTFEPVTTDEIVAPTAQVLQKRVGDVKLARAKGDTKVYYITEGGLKRLIPSPAVFLSYGNKWEDIVEVEPSFLTQYPDSVLIKLENGDGKVYKLENGMKRWIRTAEAFNRLGLDWNQIAPVNQVEFDHYPNGDDML